MRDRNRSERRASLPKVLQTAEMTIAIHNQMIPHREILLALKNYQDFLNAYHQKVLAQKTRTIRLLGKKSPAKIIHTLLGYEVQASYKRIHCPDMVTARYIRLFSEIGCHSIQLPYDPTLTAQLIPEFEAAIGSIDKQIAELFPRDLPMQRYVLQKIYGIIRQQLRPRDSRP